MSQNNPTGGPDDPDSVPPHADDYTGEPEDISEKMSKLAQGFYDDAMLVITGTEYDVSKRLERSANVLVLYDKASGQIPQEIRESFRLPRLMDYVCEWRDDPDSFDIDGFKRDFGEQAL